MADFSNATIQALFAEYGTKIRTIRTGSSDVIRLNQQTSGAFSGITNDDIVFLTIAGVDFMKVPAYDSHAHHMIAYVFRTDQFQHIAIVDNETDHLDSYCV